MGILNLLRDASNHPPRRILNHIGFRINRKLYRYDPDGYYEDGVDVFARDWDICALLDACRFDVFAERNSLPGTLTRIESRGSSTDEWFRGNVVGRDLRDVVFVAGSPSITRIDLKGAQVHAVDHVWKDSWDEDLCTVPPHITTERAIQAYNEYPDKRIFIHYLQPHYPFIGPTGREFTYEGYESPTNNPVKFWHQYGFEKGDATDEELWQAYLENVNIVLESMERLHESINGKLAITADHGELIQQRAGIIPVKRYGHPAGFHAPELLEVPWHVTQEESVRDTVSGSGVIPDNPDREAAHERLKDLGYR